MHCRRCQYARCLRARHFVTAVAAPAVRNRKKPLEFPEVSTAAYRFSRNPVVANIVVVHCQDHRRTVSCQLIRSLAVGRMLTSAASVSRPLGGTLFHNCCRRAMPSVVSLIVSMTDISVFNTPYMSAKCVVEVLEKCENFTDAKLIVSDLRR